MWLISLSQEELVRRKSRGRREWMVLTFLIEGFLISEETFAFIRQFKDSVQHIVREI